MSASRLAAIPINHVIAEMAAQPLASEQAFKLAITELDPDMAGDTAMLWRTVEQDLVRQAPSFSIDELVTIRDQIWFGQPDRRGKPAPRSLRIFLCELAWALLEPRGAQAVPRPEPWSLRRSLPASGNPSPSQAGGRGAWRWITFALPPDLLLVPLTGSGDIPGQVQDLSPTLRNSLRDEGYAETHQHVGAGMDFRLLWVALQIGLQDSTLGPDDFASPGASFDEGRDLARWLLRSAVARRILAEYLWQRASTGNAGLFGNNYLPQQVATAASSALGTSGWTALRAGLDELASGRFLPDGPSYPSLRTIYQWLLQDRRLPEDLSLAQAGDPVSDFFPPTNYGPGVATPEMRFNQAALSYLANLELEAVRSPGTEGDPLFKKLFWQIIRVRCILYRHVTQRPMTPGLQWFVRFYGRIGANRRRVTSRLLYQSAASLAGFGQGLRSLEFRTSPDPHWQAVLQTARAADRAVRDLRLNRPRSRCRGGLELGLVLHFTKDRGGGARQGLPIAHGRSGNADPGALPNVAAGGSRFGKFYLDKREEALAFGRVLCDYPVSLEVLRGVDFCTDELGVPTWVLVPLIRYVRDAGLIAQQTLMSRYGLHVPPLRTTVHVGEDFVHLLGGLRRVDEAIEYVALEEGDRIGHGMALGVNARSWAQRAGRLPMPREERLLDLAWERSFRAREGLGAAKDRDGLLEREIPRLSESIFGRPCSPIELETLVADLHTESFLFNLGFPGSRGRPSGPAADQARRAIMFRYLTDREVFRGGRETEWIETAAESEALEELQLAVRRKVGRRGIAVEVNPSSNLLIGNLAELEEHPLWRLDPPRPVELPAGTTLSRLRVCIGSDDPLTFATNLPGEYQLVRDALILGGLTDLETQIWLDRTRRNSLEARFTIPRSDLDPGLTAYSPPSAYPDLPPL